jgi:hypothetical protein
MLVTNTITKKVLETIVHETFSTLGSLSSSSLLDSLKLLGFYYATNAGISINIEDLKTPRAKKDFLLNAIQETHFVSEQWEQGFVSDSERFQRIIDSWNIATESLKNRIIGYYQNLDPANNLYIMAFSGARGNMSQVRQLVGMRGLMSDQEGNIIDLPIQTNFREGLSSIDYMISSYGARKGIVDTALKTADSGYLTRRLIYVAQDLIIRETDCNSKQGLILLLNKNTTIKNIIGRFLISAKNLSTKTVLENCSNTLLTKKKILELKRDGSFILNLRSPLTCLSNGSICQKCYGWDLAQNKLISLGEAVGIIAAQSIGEPGTQLTMRTFHTGGIFTSEMLQQTLAPFTGNIQIPSTLKSIPYRTSHGNIVLKLQQEATIRIASWDGKKEEIFLEIGSFLYIANSSFVKKGTLISEHSTHSVIPGARKLKPIYTPLAGEVRFESLYIRNIGREEKPKVKVNQDDGLLWLAAGTIVSLPKESSYVFSNKLKFNRAIASLKISTPHEGLFTFENGIITIAKATSQIKFDCSSIIRQLKNCDVEFSIITKNYQYIDKFTTIGYLNIYSKTQGSIYLARKKESQYITTYFLISESDVWKMHSDQTNILANLKEKKAVRIGSKLNDTLIYSKSGFLVKRDGFKFVYQNAVPIFLSRDAILNYKQGDFAFKQELLAMLVNYTQQTEDIVQGLPKIEELIEARSPKIKAELVKSPGIILSTTLDQTQRSSNLKDGLILNSYVRSDFSGIEKIGPSKVQYKLKHKQVSVAHSINKNKDLIFYENKIWKASPLPPGFFPFRLTGKNELCFINRKGSALLINIKGKKISAGWLPKSNNNVKILLYKKIRSRSCKTLKLTSDNFIFENKKSIDFIIKINEKYLFLEHLEPISKMALPLNAKLSIKPGSFVDIGEPITEGFVDPHELLSIFFKYHSTFDGMAFGTVRSLNKFQLLLVNSIQSIYQSQGVSISSKHVEIIIRQMTAKVIIRDSGDTPLLIGELVRLSLILEIYRALETASLKYKTPKYEPLFLSSTNSSLSKDGFLSAAGFQETKRVLTKASIEGNSDWLRGLKECILLGRLIPAGSAFLNYKNYLDNIYSFKD